MKKSGGKGVAVGAGSELARESIFATSDAFDRTVAIDPVDISLGVLEESTRSD
jgi:hypothetical protein